MNYLEDPYQTMSFTTWLATAWPNWLYVGTMVAVAVLLGTVLIAILVQGPAQGLQAWWRGLTGYFVDLAAMSPRRVWALTALTVKEAVRKRIVAVFGLFLVLLLFAGWYIDPSSTEPARLYLAFVLTTTAYLILLLVLFLSTQGLPNDIKNKTLHTVVTKPVRACEIILGRMLGFTVVGTLLLAAIGLMCYVFVVRGVAHQHDLEPADVDTVAKALARASAKATDGSAATVTVRTTLPVDVRQTSEAERRDSGAKGEEPNEQVRFNRHRHRVVFDIESLLAIAPDADGVRRGRVTTEVEQSHTHEVDFVLYPPKDGKGWRLETSLGAQQGMLAARVPHYGDLSFRSREGRPAEKGINVGDIWEYRSFIYGGTLAAAIWSFDGVTEDRYPDGLPVELSIGIFRTYKGDIDRGVPGSLSVRNPATGEMVEAVLFEGRDNTIDRQFIPRTLKAADGRALDLHRDFVADGRVEVWLKCVAANQCYGAGKKDLYLRDPNDASFSWNFTKAYIGIWLQMLLVIGFGVLASTRLGPAIGIFFTAVVLLIGFSAGFFGKLSRHELWGGGPAEAFNRLITQANVTTELEKGARTEAIRLIDRGLEGGFMAVGAMMPNLNHFDTSDTVSKGYNVPGDRMLMEVLEALGYLLPLFLLSYLLLRTREVAE